jgi:valyl-tRNA synthetase
MQWWVKVESLAKAAGDAVRNGDTVIHPASQEPRWFDWVDDMHDWCISRQLWWGHRIPIWYGPEGEVVCVGPDEQAPEGWVQDPDVLDTWFSSGLWPFSTMGWPDATPELAKFYPTSVLVTGYDILFFWVARMMMFGTFVADDAAVSTGKGGAYQIPFKDVFLHGLIRDQFGRKMSKSRGNGIDPLDWIDNYGADALRFTLARGAQPGGDLSVGEPHALASRSFVTKLFNATKFALMNGARPGPVPARETLTDADRWIVDRLDEVLAEVDAAFDAYEFGKACEALYHFAWDELCDWYLELSKVHFAESEERAESTRVVLGSVLDAVLRLLHPVIPFVTESLWQALTGAESVVVAAWPQRSGTPTDTGAAQRIADLQRLVTEIRRFRSDQGLNDKQKVAARVLGLDAAGLAHLHPEVTTLGRLTEPGADFAATASVEVRLSGTTVTVEVDTSGTVDLAAERRRLEKDLAVAQKELAGTEAKLGNEAFLAKAPEAVVDKIRARREVAVAEVERIGARLAELSGK